MLSGERSGLKGRLIYAGCDQRGENGKGREKGGEEGGRGRGEGSRVLRVVVHTLDVHPVL